MVYLSQFQFADVGQEDNFILGIRRTCYDTVYPFRILSKHQLSVLDFEPVTILYGGNGSGKTTALNVIAEKLRLQRDTLYNCELCGSVTLICLQKHCIVSKALKNQRFCLQKFEESGIILV